MIYKIFDAVVKSVDEESLIVEHFISTETPDRHGDIVRAKGMQVKGKPVVLLGHGWDTMGREPIAKPLGFDKKAEYKGVPGIIAKTKFFDDDVGRRLFRKTTEGFMPNWSIGLMPIQMRPMKDDDGREVRGREIVTWELLEYSLVAVPAQPDAQTMPGRKKEGVSEIRFKMFDPAATEGVTLCPTCCEKKIRIDVDSEHGVGVAQECEECAAVEWKDELADEKPYANEHACRLEDPKKYDRFRRQNDKFGGGLHAIWGIKEKRTELQAIRFDSSKFTAAQAKKWAADHDHKCILFEPATGKEFEDDGVIRTALDGLACEMKKMVDSSDGLNAKFKELSKMVNELKEKIDDIAEKEAEPAASTEEGEKINPQEREKGPDVIQGEEAIKLVASVAKRAMEERVRSEINRMRGKVN